MGWTTDKQGIYHY